MRLSLSRMAAGAAFAAFVLPAVADNGDGVGHFDITRFDVQGNTLLPPTAIDAMLAGYTGSRRDFGDVQRALEALEAAYHARGYKLVQVALPEQELNNGVIRLQVVETKLGSVKVEGNTAFDAANIRRSLPGLREGESPDIAAVSSSLRLANENPAKKTTLQLRGGTRDGEVEALLKVADDRPWRVAASLDNSGNKSTGESQLTMQFQHANVADLDHVLSLQYTTTVEHPSQVSVYGVGYHVPLYALGDSVDLFASYSDVDSGSVLAGIFNLQVSGRGTVFGGRYNQILARRGQYDSRLSYGLDYKAFRNDVVLAGIQLGNDVTVHPLSVAYAGNWTAGASETGFAVSAVQNLPGGERGGSADFNRVRAGASASYTILRYNASYARALPHDWQMRLSLAGQYSNDALVPGEQFGAGGAGSVRGFHERELSNDSGRFGSAEIYTPNFCPQWQGIAGQCRVLAFYDNAHVRRNNPLPAERARESISSVGLGLRMNLGKSVALQVDYGHVLDGGPVQQAGDDRVHVRLGLTY